MGQTLLALTVLGAMGAGLQACGGPATGPAPIVVTIPPLKLILQEIVGERAEVICILPPGASPHTFELRPSTAQRISGAKALFYVDETIDGWAARNASGPRDALFDMVPEQMRIAFDGADGHVHNHDHSTKDVRPESNQEESWNAHFWSDPLVVAAIVPRLVEVLSSLDPDGAAQYSARGQAFQESLTRLDGELRDGRPSLSEFGLVAFHPSWDYFLARYGLSVSAYIEPFPGKEPTPRAMQAIQEAVLPHARRLILSEEQLPAKPAQVLAELLDAPLIVIDPLGGPPGRDTYADFLRYNAELIWGALR